MKTRTKPTWGLALSGGTACGLANIGILEVLTEHGLQPNFLAGSSMGAIIGSLYALGYSPNELHTIATKIPLHKLAKLSEKPLRGGLQGGLLRQGVADYLQPYIGNQTIGDCRIPFVCVAGKIINVIQWSKILESGFSEHVQDCIEPHIFEKHVRVLDAIMASSAMPVIFSPMEIDNTLFVDMILFGSIPTRSLRQKYHPTIMIGTDTNEPVISGQNLLPRGLRDFLEFGSREKEKSKAICDLVIKPELPYPQYRFDKAEEFIQAGRQAALPLVPSIWKLVEI